MQVFENSRGDLMRAAVAAIIAVVATVALFLFEIGPKNEAHGNGIGMITSAAADRAGATVLPTAPY